MNYTQYYETRKRDNDDYFTCLKDGIPDSMDTLLSDLHHSVHKDLFDGCFPNDWIYMQIHSAFEALEEGRDLDSIRSELEPDCYTSDLIEWSRNPWAQSYIDEAMQEMGAKSFDQAIGWGQVIAMERIYSMVNEFIEEQANNEELEE